MFNWNFKKSILMINPRTPTLEQDKIHKLISHFSHLEDHFWIGTSGSTQQKWVALSKEAVLTSAQAVNTHLQCSANDIWINPLPVFHVGGLGIIARAHLSGSSVVEFNSKWNPQTFYETLLSHKATLTSLVPAQVYDLVNLNLVAPKALRVIIVGGGALDELLYKRAVALKWPLLPSYGMTECASQIATVNPKNCLSISMPVLEILPHMQVRLDDENRFCIFGKSLLTGYAYHENDQPVFQDPKNNGWLVTEDTGELDGKHLFISGRLNDFIKIGGESVHIGRLEHIFDEARRKIDSQIDCALFAATDERLGHTINAACTCSEEAFQPIVNLYNETVLPFEKIRKIVSVGKIPRSELGKVKRSELKTLFINN